MHLTRRETLNCASAIGLAWWSGACIRRGKIDTYTDPALTPGRVRSIAFLPFRNVDYLPPEAREINEAIGNAFVKRNPGLSHIVSDEQAGEILRPSGLMDEWARLFNASDPESAPDGNLTRKIGRALNVDAIMQGGLVGAAQRHGRIGFLTGAVGMSGVAIRYHLYAASDAQLLWSATAQGIATTASSLQPAPDPMVAINLALTEIYKYIPPL